MTADRDRLAQAALGGRVAHSGFLDPDESARLAAELRDAGVGVHVSGGFPGARRRVVTAFPAHVPEATTALTAVYFEGLDDADELRAALRSAGVDPGALGDVVRHQDGLSLVTTAPPPAALRAPLRVRGVPAEGTEVGLERVAAGSARRQQVVVPALRVDTLGAKAFRVSRSFFAKGVQGGKVSVNGAPVGKSATAEAGDEIYAEGLGRMRIVSVEGETKRGNLKVTVEVEKS